MKIQKISSILLLLVSNYALAGQDLKPELQAKREHVIHQYIIDLGKADYQDISSLFEEGGTVISTSRGKVNAQEFFHSFLPEIDSATTEFHQSFISKSANNHYAARFNFLFKLKDGETGEGEYIDEFIFAKNSSKLVRVYMFENLKFKMAS
jgi:hypothetical protein